MRSTGPPLLACCAVAVLGGCSPCPTIDGSRWLDPEASSQWYLDALHVPPPGALGPGAEIRVAVIDNGFALAHPDLAPALIVEGGAVVGVDLLAGDLDPELGSETGRVRGHGTACASLVAATPGDGIGLAGLCPSCRLLPIRARDFDADSSVLPELPAAIDWALEHGARVLSISDGSRGADLDPALLAEISAALERAEAGGLVVVASAGNDEGGPVRIPAALPTVIAVAATDEHGAASVFTSRGPEVDVAAPGECVWAADADRGHAVFRGTSASAPIVAALAAWILSLEPTLTPSDVRARIRLSAHPVSGGPDLGAGIVDFSAALGL